MNLNIVSTKCFNIPLYTNKTVLVSKLIIENIQNYYNFHVDENYNLKSYLMSDHTNSIIIEPLPKIKHEEREIIEKEDPDKIKPVQANANYLQKK